MHQPCPAVSDSGFAFGAKICSKFAAGIRRGQCRQQRTTAADDSIGKGQGEVEAEQREAE